MSIHYAFAEISSTFWFILGMVFLCELISDSKFCFIAREKNNTNYNFWDEGCTGGGFLLFFLNWGGELDG